MAALITLTGVAACLPACDINTDIIAPLVRSQGGPQPAGIRSQEELARRLFGWRGPCRSALRAICVPPFFYTCVHTPPAGAPGIKEYLASDNRHEHVFADDWRADKGIIEAP